MGRKAHKMTPVNGSFRGIESPDFILNISTFIPDEPTLARMEKKICERYETLANKDDYDEEIKKRINALLHGEPVSFINEIYIYDKKSKQSIHVDMLKEFIFHNHPDDSRHEMTFPNPYDDCELYDSNKNESKVFTVTKLDDPAKLSKGKRSVLSMYERDAVYLEQTISFQSNIHGLVRITISYYENPQIMNGIRFMIGRNTKKMNGLYCYPYMDEDVQIPRIDWIHSMFYEGHMEYREKTNYIFETFVSGKRHQKKTFLM